MDTDIIIPNLILKRKSLCHFVEKYKLVGQNCTLVNACFPHIGLVLWTLGKYDATSNQSPVIATHQTCSQDFVQERANLTRAQGTPYQKPKIYRVSPTIFLKNPDFFLFFNILFYFSIPVRSLFAAWNPTCHSAFCSTALSSPTTLLDHIFDCSVLSWLFDASLYLGASRQPPCCSDRHSVDELVPF